MGKFRICEQLKVDNLLTPQAIASTTAATPATYWRSMEGFHNGALVITAATDNGSTVISTLKQATNAAGTDPQDFSVTKTLTLTGVTANGLGMYGIIEFNQQEVYARGNGTHLFVGVSVTTNSTSEVAVALLRGDPRYATGLTSFPTSGAAAETAVL